MIDIENEIYTCVKKAVGDNAKVFSRPMSTVAEFPCVVFYETDNYVPRKIVDTSNDERFAVVTYDVNVYSNDQTKGKTECKKLINIVDETMRSLGFRRTTKSPVAIDRATIYRIVCRYTATVSNTENIYGG